LSAQERAASLWGRLAAGEVPDWLTPLPSQASDAFRVYLIKS